MSRCASRRKPSAAEKSRTIRIVSARHAARPPSASILDLALPHYRTAPGRIPATNRAAWYPTAHSCATSDTNESLHLEIELQHVGINHPSNQSARTKQQQLVCRSGTKPARTHALAESNTISSELAPHAQRPLESGPRTAPLAQCVGSHPSHEPCGIVSHGACVHNIRHK